MTGYRTTATANVDAVVRHAIAEENHALGGWISGVTFGLIFGIFGAMGGGDLGGAAGALGGGLVGVLLGTLSTWALVRRANRTLATRIRRILAEGRRFEGQVVMAQRRSMTQSRVIVQGAGFVGVEKLVSTNVPDAQLLGSTVEVFVHPELGTHFVLGQA